MFRVLHQNRWFIWALAFILGTFFFLWGVIEQYSLELDRALSESEYSYAVKELRGSYDDSGSTSSPSTSSGQFETDVSNWKTYRNEKYGFEFRYPPSFQTPIEKSGGIEFGNVNSEYPEDSRLFIMISDNNKNLDQLIQELYREESTPRLAYGGSGVGYYNIEKLFIDGKEGLKFDAHYEGGLSSTNVYVIYDKHLYKIFYNTEVKEFSLEEFKIFISTLKFFEPRVR